MTHVLDHFIISLLFVSVGIIWIPNVLLEVAIMILFLHTFIERLSGFRDVVDPHCPSFNEIDILTLASGVQIEE